MCHWICLSFAAQWWTSAVLLLCTAAAFTPLLASTRTQGNLSHLMLIGAEVPIAMCQGLVVPLSFQRLLALNIRIWFSPVTNMG